MLQKVVSWFSGRGREADEAIWSRDLENYSHGKFSFAAVKANAVIEDKSQVEAGRAATFIGIYDGHGGDAASTYIHQHLFPHLLELARGNSSSVDEEETMHAAFASSMKDEIINNAFSRTEDGFLGFVRSELGATPRIAQVGSCCLVGVIHERLLLTANLGDSRAVIGSWNSASDQIIAEQLTDDHNVSSNVDVRNELESSHPDDPNIVVYRDGNCYIRGITKVSRSIGDAYLKMPELALPELHLTRSILRADPQTNAILLQENHRFIIYASRGLWDLLGNKEAVDIVAHGPKEAAAKKLIEAALRKAANRSNTTYEEMMASQPRERRYFYDDITVIVLFIDPIIIRRRPPLSVHAYRNHDKLCRFSF